MKIFIYTSNYPVFCNEEKKNVIFQELTLKLLKGEKKKHLLIAHLRNKYDSNDN